MRPVVLASHSKEPQAVGLLVVAVSDRYDIFARRDPSDPCEDVRASNWTELLSEGWCADSRTKNLKPRWKIVSQECCQREHRRAAIARDLIGSLAVAKGNAYLLGYFAIKHHDLLTQSACTGVHLLMRANPIEGDRTVWRRAQKAR
jgi:hypothetical protein